MKRFLALLVIAGVLVGAFYLVGTVLPRVNSTACRATFKTEPEKVFDALVAVEQWPQWNRSILHLERMPDEDDRAVFHATGPDGVLTRLERTSFEKPARMSISFQEPHARGTLRYELKRFGDGVIVRVTQQRDVKDPWRRAAGLFTAQNTSMLRFLEDLGSRVGETVTVELL